MPNYVFSFIGTGSMGSALARAACRSVPPEKVLLANRTYSKAQALANALGCVPAASNILAAELADYVFLGVKPDQMATVAREIGPALRQRRDPFVLVTMAAGLTMKQVCEMVGSPCPVIRVMPNTPSEVGAGLILYDANERVTERDLAHFTELMSSAGTLDRLEEALIDAGSAVVGCGPAFAALFLEALADGGVACGLPREKAVLYAAQMLEGTARLLRETGQHPGQMKDAVCPPGGSTIAGVRVLEQRGFRAAAMDAVLTAWERTQGLGKTGA